MKLWKYWKRSELLKILYSHIFQYNYVENMT